MVAKFNMTQLSKVFKKNKDFIDLEDFSSESLEGVLELSKRFKLKKPEVAKQFLKGKTVVMLFTKSSTRTRVSFERAIFELGGQSIFLSHRDIQLGRGETIPDTGKVLERYANAIVIRTYAHEEVHSLAKAIKIPVINGLTDENHPCQILADLLTLQENKGFLKKLKLAFVGDGNNIANTLAVASLKLGFELRIASPKEFQCTDKLKKQVAQAPVSFLVDPREAVKGVDAVYTDTWVSMGDEAESKKRLKILQPYQVNQKLFSLAKPEAIFLHCLPAHRGEEVTDEVMDSPRSLVFDQAENRLHVQKAVLSLLLK